MSDLLSQAVAAHGGLERWRQVGSVSAHVSVGGAIWHVKGWPDVLSDARFTIDARRQHTECERLAEPDRRWVYEPGETAILSESGRSIERRESPRTSFDGHSLPTRWDVHHLIYFTGYAMWTYLTVPFLFLGPGFRTEEIAPWNDEGEMWRRLKVTFPSTVHSHCTEQIFYFDSAGLLRRHDYSVDIMGGTSSANYASEHKAFGGLIFPTKRRVFSKGPDNRPMRERVAVAIDVLDVEVAA